MRISDWSSDVCSSDLRPCAVTPIKKGGPKAALFVNGCLSDQHFSFTCAASVGLQSGLFGLNSVGAVSVAKVGLFSRVSLAQIGRASCRARVCQYVYIWVVAVSLKKKASKIIGIM